MLTAAYVQNEIIRREDSESYANTLETFRNELNERVKYLEERLSDIAKERKVEEERLIHTITEEMARSKASLTAVSGHSSSEAASVDSASDRDIRGSDDASGNFPTTYSKSYAIR